MKCDFDDTNRCRSVCAKLCLIRYRFVVVIEENVWGVDFFQTVFRLLTTKYNQYIFLAFLHFNVLFYN